MSQQVSSVASRVRGAAEKGFEIKGDALIPIAKPAPSLSSISDRNGISSASSPTNFSTTSLNTSQNVNEKRIPPPISASFASCSYNSAASLSFSCLDSFNYPVFVPKHTIPAELMSPKSKLSGSGSDAITDGKGANGAPPPSDKVTPPPQETNKNSKPLYYDTNLCLTDFIKALYGIRGPTTGRGRDIGTTTLTTEERLRNRQLLYKNVSPLSPNNDSSNSSSPKIMPSSPSMQIPSSPKSRKLLLALDLDETLVHAFIGLKYPLPGADAHVEITTSVGNPPRRSVNAMYIRYRPHISEFMSVVAPLFDVVLFTAARPIYADTLMNVMDPKGSVIGKNTRYFRDSCTDVYNRYEAGSLVMSPKGLSTSIAVDQNEKEVVAAVAAEAGCETANGLPPLAEPGFIRTKDLVKLGRPLEEIILVDNTPTCGLMQPRNLLPISSWFGTDTDDKGLLSIIPVLKKIAATRDVYGCLDEYCASMQPVV